MNADAEREAEGGRGRDGSVGIRNATASVAQRVRPLSHVPAAETASLVLYGRVQSSCSSRGTSTTSAASYLHT